MPVHYPDLPANVREAFLEGVKDYLWKEPELGEKIGKAGKACRGVPVYTLTLREFLHGAATENRTARVGWRVFLTIPDNGKEPVKKGQQQKAPKMIAVAGDVVTNAVTGRAWLTSLSRGPQLAARIAAVKKNENSPDLKDDEYELRLLRIPGVLAETAWYRSKTALRDWASPTLTGAKEFKGKCGYLQPLESFLGTLRPIAERFKHFQG